MSSDKNPYQLFKSSGKKVSFEKMMKEISEADIVFFGELHNNALSHWMEFEIAKELYSLKKEKLIIGAEMFEADQQLLVDEYINGVIEKKYFEDQARLWDNHKTDYAPVIDFAQEQKIRFIATNIPRRYAAYVNKYSLQALDSLPTEAKKFIAELPIKYDSEVACYKEMNKMMAGMPGARHKKSYIAEAQAIKDATMAHFILKSIEKGDLFFHFNGSYHSDNYEGIVWWIKQKSPDLKIVTITTTEVSDTDSIAEDDLKKADFILQTDEDFTKTY
ncbi:MAG: ChaN family lipoprotein [Bacteroidales bacterium]|nr:ChaN family lipoprotein [Bacteroidales bacterium]